MTFWRTTFLCLLCLCLAASGPAAAMVMAAVPPATADGSGDCASMHASQPAASPDAATPTRGHGPDCCAHDACRCAGAHGAVATMPRLTGADGPPPGSAVGSGPASAYASPALALLVRPPIS